MREVKLSGQMDRNGRKSYGYTLFLFFIFFFISYISFSVFFWTGKTKIGMKPGFAALEGNLFVLFCFVFVLLCFIVSCHAIYCPCSIIILVSLLVL